MKLFLDDIRQPNEVWRNTIDSDYEQNSTWIVVRSYEDFVSFISEKGLPELISFDHDLVYEHYLDENQRDIDYARLDVKTGYHAAEWLIAYCQERSFRLPKTKVHSMNPAGRNNIIQLLERAEQQD